MRLFLNILLGIAVSITSTATAGENSTDPELPTPDKVREYYQEVAREWPELPRPVLLAFVAAEDKDFFDRPLYRSPITGKLWRWYFPSRVGKLQKTAFSFIADASLTHDEVLNWYANEMYFGQACFGVPDAAMAYYGKPVADLELEEIAYLAGLLKAPSVFHPVRQFDRALQHRNFILSRMLAEGFLSETEAENAIQTALVVQKPLARCETKD